MKQVWLVTTSNVVMTTSVGGSADQKSPIVMSPMCSLRAASIGSWE